MEKLIPRRSVVAPSVQILYPPSSLLRSFLRVFLPLFRRVTSPKNLRMNGACLSRLVTGLFRAPVIFWPRQGPPERLIEQLHYEGINLGGCSLGMTKPSMIVSLLVYRTCLQQVQFLQYRINPQHLLLLRMLAKGSLL